MFYTTNPALNFVVDWTPVCDEVVELPILEITDVPWLDVNLHSCWEKPPTICLALTDSATDTLKDTPKRQESPEGKLIVAYTSLAKKKVFSSITHDLGADWVR